MTTLEGVETRVTVLETEFRTELRHLATKADLARLESELRSLENRLMLRLGGLYIAGIGVAVAIMKLWQ